MRVRYWLGGEITSRSSQNLGRYWFEGEITSRKVHKRLSRWHDSTLDPRVRPSRTLLLSRGNSRALFLQFVVLHVQSVTRFYVRRSGRGSVLGPIALLTSSPQRLVSYENREPNNPCPEKATLEEAHQEFHLGSTLTKSLWYCDLQGSCRSQVDTFSA